MFQQVTPEYWSCMGETVLKKSKFDQDTANARAFNREMMNQLSTLNNADSPFAKLYQTPAQQVPVAPVPLTPFQSFLQTIARPFVMMANMMQQLPQQLIKIPMQFAQTVLVKAEQVIAQLFTFFMGNKKDKTEEKKQRDENDESLLGWFGENPFDLNKVSQSEQSNMGGGDT